MRKDFAVIMIISAMIFASLFFVVRGEMQKWSSEKIIPGSTYDESQLGFSLLFDVLDKLGYRPERLTGRFREALAGDLRDSLLILNNSYGRYDRKTDDSVRIIRESDLDFLENWVREGGSLVILTDSTEKYEVSGQLGSRFGFSVSSAFNVNYGSSIFWQGSDWFRPVIEGPFPDIHREIGRIETSNDSRVSLVGEAEENRLSPNKEDQLSTNKDEILWTNKEEILFLKVHDFLERDIAIGYTFGKGKVLVISDPFPFTNEGIKNEDNVLYAVGILESFYGLSLDRIVFNEYFFDKKPNPRNLFFVLPLWGRMIAIQLVICFIAALAYYLKRFGKPVPVLEAEDEGEDYIKFLSNLYKKCRAGNAVIEDQLERLRQSMAAVTGLGVESGWDELIKRCASMGRLKHLDRVRRLIESCETAIAGKNSISEREMLKLGRALEKYGRELAGYE